MVPEIEHPDVLYHYTSLSALLEIFKGRKIWATNAKFLNDTQEHSFLIDAMARYFSYKDCPHASRSHQFIGFIKQNAEVPFIELPYIASFSRDGDSLSQWRAYASGGNGVAIGFRKSCLLKASGPPARYSVGNEHGELASILNLHSVEYMEENKDNLARVVGELLEKTDLEFQDWGFWNSTDETDSEDGETPPPSTAELADLLAVNTTTRAALVKHASFKEESEVRLISAPHKIFPYDIHYRASKTTLVPYVELDLPMPSESLASDLQDHFITEVIVGPSPNKSLSVESLKAFFQRNFFNVRVRGTNAPYRDWL